MENNAPTPPKKISIDVQIFNHSTYQQMGSLKRSHLNEQQPKNRQIYKDL